MLKHHLNPVGSLLNYDQSQAVLPSRPDLDAIDFVVMNDSQRVDAIAEANELEEIYLKPWKIKYLIDFLNALTDPAAIDIRRNTPRRVPSGLPMGD
jgi:cytochrome c peroxidase